MRRIFATKAFVSLFFIVVASLGDQCFDKPEVVVPDADVQFGLLLSLRESATPGECGDGISRRALEQFLVTEWLVNRINAYNNGTGYIPNLKLGFKVINDCGSPLLASRNVLTYLDTWTLHTGQCQAELPWLGNSGTGASPLPIGIIGGWTSSIAKEVSSLRLLHEIPLPVISTTATDPVLSVKERYPTSMRTQPSDDMQMDAITKLLETLGWTYVAVIHVNDDYGRAASASLTRLAPSRGVCIKETLVLTTGTFRDLMRLLQSAKDSSIAVVFISNSDNAVDLLYEIKELGFLNGRTVLFGLRIIFAACQDGVIHTTVFGDNKFGEGTLAMDKQRLDFSHDLGVDMDDLIRRVNESRVSHPLIEEYLQTGSPGGELFADIKHSIYIGPSIHAVLALVEGLRSLTMKAKDKRVKQIQTHIEEGEFLKSVRESSINYGGLSESVAPFTLRNQSFVVRFDANGDVVTPNLPAYTVEQYRKDETKYHRVGMYSDEKMDAHLSEMRWITPAGVSTPSLPTSVCSERCDQVCQHAQGRSPVPLVFMNGTQGYILGVFAIHDTNSDNPFECGDFRVLSNDVIVAEGFLYAVKKLREITGLNLGAVAIDSCYSPVRPLSLLHDLFSKLPSTRREAFPDLGDFSLDQVVGVVGCRSSGCTIPTASFFTQLKIPVVSYASSSPDLDDASNFPYFLRTVPSDVYQVEVIMEIIRAIKWEYVGLLYVKNNYGTKAMETFKQLASETRQESNTASSEDEGDSADGEPAWPGVCVAEEIYIEERESPKDEQNFFEIWKHLVNNGVKIVVFIGIDARYRDFLTYLKDNKKDGDFIFILGEDWGDNKKLLEDLSAVVRGSMSLKVEEIDLVDVDEFKTHLANKRPSEKDTNIWFMEYWQHHFKCNWPGGFINIYDRKCTSDMKLSAEDVASSTSEQRFRHGMNAAYAVGKGIKLAKKLCEFDFPCDSLRREVGEVVDSILEQSMTSGSEEFRVFDDNGNGALGFDVFSIQRLDNGQYHYVKVGTFNSRDKTFDTSKIRFYSKTNAELTSVDGKCTSILCAHCPSRVDPKPTPAAGVTHYESSCKFEEPDIIIISLIGVLILAVLVAAAAVVACLCCRNNALHKQMSPRKEVIYDEPDRQVYEQYQTTHGFGFANLNTAPLLSGRDPLNLAPHHHGMGYPQTRIGAAAEEGYLRNGHQGAFHNEGFVHDSMDSVSQILNHRRSPSHQPAMGIDVARTRVQSLQGSKMNSPSPSQRPLPVTPIGPTDTMSNIMQDNMAYHDALSDVMVPRGRRDASTNNTPTHTTRSVPSNTPSHTTRSQASDTPTHTAHSHSSPTHSSGNNHTVSMNSPTSSSNSFLSNTSGATKNSIRDTLASPLYHHQHTGLPPDAGMNYYIHDPTRPSAAQFRQPLPLGAIPRGMVMSPSMSPNHAIHQSRRAPPLVHQASTQSDQSSVHPAYGPYSQAAAQQRQQQQILQQLDGQHQDQEYMREGQGAPVPSQGIYQQEENIVQELSPHEQQIMLQQYMQLLQQQHQQLQHQQQMLLQQQQQHINDANIPPTSSSPLPHPPHSGNHDYLELVEMPGRSFFTPQQLQHSPQHHDHHIPETPVHLQRLEPPSPDDNMSELSSPDIEPQQQSATTPVSLANDPAPVYTTIATSPMNIQNAHATTNEDSTNNQLIVDNPVDVTFDPKLSHDPRLPNDLQLHSIDLTSSTASRPVDASVPEVRTQGAGANRNRSNNRSNLFGLSVLRGNVSDV